MEHKDIDAKRVYGEIKEHLVDCNTNRSKHFIKYTHIKKWKDRINFTQNIALIFTTLVLALYAASSDLLPGFQKITLVITIISAFISAIALWSQISNYDDAATQHWMAAQAYQELYRECQFFHNQFPVNSDFKEAAKIAEQIRIRLNHLNLVSPHIPFSKAEKKKHEKQIEEEKIENTQITSYDIIKYSEESVRSENNEA